LINYLVRRLLYAIPTLVGVLLLTFALFYLVTPPEQLARQNLSAKNPTKKQIDKWLKDHGYDQPRSEQFKKSTLGLMTFDLGKSDRTKEPIINRIKQGAGPSGTLASMILLTALVTALTLATTLAYFRGTYVDRAGTVLGVLLLSVPYIVYVLSMQYLMGKLLRYGPMAGFEPGWQSLRFIVIPVIIGVVARIGGDVRLYRTFLLDEMNRDYVRTARAKGVKESAILFKHVLKNSMIPVITTVVAIIPSLILGSIIIEATFGIPGIGGYLQEAIQNKDFAVIRAMVFIGTLLYIVGLILTDLLYAVVDPRVRIQ